MGKFDKIVAELGGNLSDTEVDASKAREALAEKETEKARERIFAALTEALQKGNTRRPSLKELVRIGFHDSKFGLLGWPWQREAVRDILYEVERKATSDLMVAARKLRWLGVQREFILEIVRNVGNGRARTRTIKRRWAGK